MALSSKTTTFLVLLIVLVVSAHGPSVQAGIPCGICPGVCGRPDPNGCNIACFVADPVCGRNGKTYTCGCTEAVCNGVPVVRKGHC